jgi:hypothetical protein
MSKLPRPLRYLVYVLLFLLWLTVMLTPCFAITLASQGELEWKRGEGNLDRIWLIQEAEQRGLGYYSERVESDERAGGGPMCVRSNAVFFLWEGATDDLNAEFCACYAADRTALGACP